MKIVSAFLLSLLFAVPYASGQSTSAKPKPVIALTIRSATIFKAGALVPVHVVLQNISSHDIVIEREVRGTDCSIDVRDVVGKLPPDTKFGLVHNGHASITDPSQIDPRDLNGKLVTIPVAAGKTWEWDLDVARFYDLSKPGRYLIFVEKPDPEDSSLAPVRSNTIEITITA